MNFKNFLLTKSFRSIQLCSIWLILLLISATPQFVHATSPDILKTAHSHNDYLRNNPLDDALNAGFWSVEADVFLRRGKLVVAHTVFGTLRNRCFEKLYLKPLAERVKQYEGYVYPEIKKGFTLMIDIKSDATETFDSIQILLEKYKWMLTQYKEDGTLIPGAVTILISGNRNIHQILNTQPRLAAVDGRKEHLDGQYSSKQVPRISISYRSVFKWRGRGEMPEAEKEKLNELVNTANEHGYQLRFWAATNRESVWKELLNAGVHIINVDRINQYKKFKRSYMENE